MTSAPDESPVGRAFLSTTSQGVKPELKDTLASLLRSVSPRGELRGHGSCPGNQGKSAKFGASHMRAVSNANSLRRA